MGKQLWRWPAVTMSIPIDDDGHYNLNCRIDIIPSTNKAQGVMIWRDNGQGKGHDIDRAFDRISRKMSRVMQGRAP